MSTIVPSADVLRDEHVRLDREFTDLCERAATGDWQVCDEIWGSFAADLEDHMRFEEEHLLAPFERAGDDAALRAADLRREHRHIRAQLEQLGVDIQLHVISAVRIDAFVASLRAHAALEGKTLYPWLATLPAAHPPAPREAAPPGP